MASSTPGGEKPNTEPVYKASCFLHTAPCMHGALKLMDHIAVIREVHSLADRMFTGQGPPFR